MQVCKYNKQRYDDDEHWMIEQLLNICNVIKYVAYIIYTYYTYFLHTDMQMQ